MLVVVNINLYIILNMLKFLMFSVLFVFLSCNSSPTNNVEKLKSCDCDEIQQDDFQGKTIFKICNYLKLKGINTSPISPCDYKIRKIDTVVIDEVVNLRIILDCCYLGDVVNMDMKKDSIISFRKGAQ